MLKTFVSTSPYNLYVEVEATKGVELMLYGYEPLKDNTVHFLRQYGDKNVNSIGLFKGYHTFEFPFPYPPESKLKIDVYDGLTGENDFVRIKNIYTKKLENLIITFPTHLQEFMDFALQFSRNCGFMPLGVYESKNSLYTIVFSNYVTSWENGTNDVVKTPARVDHNTGIIEISKWWFDQLSITNRMMIIGHEFAHFYFNTKDESECDIIGTTICLQLGFSKTECMYAISRLFDNCGTDEQCKEYIKRQQNLINFIQKWSF